MNAEKTRFVATHANAARLPLTEGSSEKKASRLAAGPYPERLGGSLALPFHPRLDSSGGGGGCVVMRPYGDNLTFSDSMASKSIPIISEASTREACLTMCTSVNWWRSRN